MHLAELVAHVEGELSGHGDADRTVSGCYVSDLLSDVLSNGQDGSAWVTHHTHQNIVAVAAVKGLSAVVVVDGKVVEQDTLARARAEGVNLVLTKLSAFETTGRIYELIKAQLHRA